MMQPYQFIGFAGLGNFPQQANILARIFTKFTDQQVNIQSSLDQGLSQVIWQVAMISNNYADHLPNYFINNSNDQIIAQLSAGGFVQPDIWVKIQNNPDKHSNIILGREICGRSPLYWLQINQVIWFSSHLQLLTQVLEQPQISIAGLYGYSCFSYVPTPVSAIDRIYTIPAGQELIFDLAKAQHYYVNQYEWRESTDLIQDENIAIEQLQVKLKRAIARQIEDMPDQPVGVFLSGGIDSAIVAALLVQMGVQVRAYTLDFTAILPDANLSELPYAEQIANYLQIPLVKVPVTIASIQTVLGKIGQALDTPFGDGAPLPLLILSQVASQEVQIIFNGENGDQLFAGWTNKPLIAAGIYEGLSNTDNSNFAQQYLKTFHGLADYTKDCFQLPVYQEIQKINPIDWLTHALDKNFCTDMLARLRRASLMLKGAQNIQPRANNIALSQGLWVRSPFCDLDLAEFAFQLPGTLCLQGSCEKYILKKAVESWLPSEVVWREKQGMAVPVTSLCLQELRPVMRTLLSPSRLQAQGLWRPELTYQIISGQMGGDIRRGKIGRILWLLMMWQLWYSSIFMHDYPLNHFYDMTKLPPRLVMKLNKFLSNQD
jgi:asparagine synthase (glutamine-hydrolysing)